MKDNCNKHTFHIPVMGIGYTIDTPIRVAHLGISSVISLVDDILIEKIREYYCKIYDYPYLHIQKNKIGSRAERITQYLNLLDSIVTNKFEELKNSFIKKTEEIARYFELLPNLADLKKEFYNKFEKKNDTEEIKKWLDENLTRGSIDVNIMTKMDKENFIDGIKLEEEHNDGRAALRGFALSNLNSSVILSSGMNPKLYSYLENFEDFYPDENGYLKKKIVLKVSDYRSAQIQGKFLARKGLWVSEYRVESGLNCGGHAFATAGYLLGPILEEFKNSRNELAENTFEILKLGLAEKKCKIPNKVLPLKITAQGGVGTSQEHNFLLDYYQVDSVGWGTPFLLVEDIVAVDEKTRQLLINATEEDLYLSNISPLQVPFNNLKNNTKDKERDNFINNNTPGTLCTKMFSAGNFEFTENAICLASRQYQTLKISELKKQNLSEEEFNRQYKQVIAKSCICVGLGTSALLKYNLDTKSEGQAVSICPGPNLAYFNKKVTLKEMTDHIYGRTNIIERTDRPNMFIKELGLYLDNFKNYLDNLRLPTHPLEEKFYKNYQNNLKEGIEYYKKLFAKQKHIFDYEKFDLFEEIDKYEKILDNLIIRWNNIIN